MSEGQPIIVDMPLTNSIEQEKKAEEETKFEDLPLDRRVQLVFESNKLILAQQEAIIEQMIKMESIVMNMALSEGYAELVRDEQGEPTIKLYKTKKTKTGIIKLN